MKMESFSIGIRKYMPSMDDLQYLGRFSNNIGNSEEHEFPIKNSNDPEAGLWFLSEAKTEEEAKSNLARARDFLSGRVHKVDVGCTAVGIPGKDAKWDRVYSTIETFDSDNMPDMDEVIYRHVAQARMRSILFLGADENDVEEMSRVIKIKE